jgi:hypothetical protein
MMMAVLDKTSDAGRGELHAKEIAQELAGSCIGNNLTGDQVCRYRRNADTILCWRSDLCGEAGTSQVLAGGTPLLFGLMFCDPEPFRRQIDDLTFLCQSGRSSAEIMLAACAALDAVDQDGIRYFDLAQCMALMSWLASTWFAALLAQQFGHADKTVRGRREAAVVAIFGLSLFQRVHSLPQTRDHFFQTRDLLLAILQAANRRTQACTQILIGLAQVLQLVFLVLDLPFSIQGGRYA